jgi:hypothetical protein
VDGDDAQHRQRGGSSKELSAESVRVGHSRSSYPVSLMVRPGGVRDAAGAI